jgi:excinuclease ABC subunit A
LAKTLSGGELQRIRLASQIGTGLTGVLYVLDEPSIGLHPKDVAALINSLKKLRDIGNSLIVVEHDQETMEAADWLVELGPEAGKAGGKLVFEGSLSEMKKSKKSLTGMYLSGKRKIEYTNLRINESTNNRIRENPLEIRVDLGEAEAGSEKQIEYLELKGCNQFNLKNIDVKLPLGKLIAVTGVSGSGKSTLIVETLYPALKYYVDGYYNETMGEFKDIKGTVNVKKVYLVDQSPIGRTPRSNPATYVGFFDTIRDVFAATTESRARGFQKGRFSFNVKGGRCEKCEGAGVLKVEMQFLADVFVICDVCHGARYNAETLEVTYRGKTISEVLNMTVDEAAEFFVNHPKISEKLNLLKKVGLGYIGLGQSAPTLSGGEAQRIKLADELSRRDNGQNVYILDEPTTGLHFYDVEKLLHTLRALVNRGNTVIVIEHNLDVIKNSDWILDLGPDGGEAGGEIVYQGETMGILKCEKSYTGEYLKKILSNTN